MEDGKERCSNNAREMRNKQWGPKKKKKKRDHKGKNER